MSTSVYWRPTSGKVYLGSYLFDDTQKFIEIFGRKLKPEDATGLEFAFMASSRPIYSDVLKLLRDAVEPIEIIFEED